MKNDVVYLRHMLDAIEWIESYVRDLSENDFLANHLVQDAVIRQIAIIGEAARQVSPEFQQQHSAIPWADMKAMRNILVHDYLGVDVLEVWKTVRDDLPELKAQIVALLQSNE